MTTDVDDLFDNYQRAAQRYRESIEQCRLAFANLETVQRELDSIRAVRSEPIDASNAVTWAVAEQFPTENVLQGIHVRW